MSLPVGVIVLAVSYGESLRDGMNGEVGGLLKLAGLLPLLLLLLLLLLPPLPPR